MTAVNDSIDIQFRIATIEDLHPLRHLARHTFTETYLGKGSQDPAIIAAQKDYIATSFTEEQWRKEVEDEKSIFIVCERKVSADAAKSQSAAPIEKMGEGDCAAPSSLPLLTVTPTEENEYGSSHFLAYAKLVVGAVEEELDMGPNPKRPAAAPTTADASSSSSTGHTRSPIRLQRIYVAPSFIGKLGIGTRLMAECEAVARAHRCDLMWLGCVAWNVDAVKFYEAKHGYRKVGHLYFVMADIKRENDLFQKDLWWPEY